MRIEDIPEEILFAVRHRFGVEDIDDTSSDKEIQTLSAKELMMKWSGWETGDEDIAEEFIEKYEELKEIERINRGEHNERSK